MVFIFLRFVESTYVMFLLQEKSKEKSKEKSRDKDKKKEDRDRDRKKEDRKRESKDKKVKIEKISVKNEPMSEDEDKPLVSRESFFFISM